MSCSVKIILYIHKTYSTGEHPVMLYLVKDRLHKRIGLGYRSKPDEWDDKLRQFKKKVPNATQRNLILAQHLERAMKIIDQFNSANTDFTFLDFESRFRGETVVSAPTSAKQTIHQLFQEKIRNLKESRRMGNAKVYEDTFRSFFNFAPGKDLKFSALSVAMLEKYEVFLRKNGGTDGGISVKFRTLRAIYNDALKKGYADANDYPFKKYGVNKLKSGGIKKALDRDEVRLIENLDLEQHPHLRLTRDLFVFSYFARGMNFVDMMKLTWSDINDNRITYIRSKTGKPFLISIEAPVKSILDYYKAQPSNTNHVFPILLKTHLSPQQVADRKTKMIKRYNKELKEVATIVGINKPLSSYVARHSFATNLKFVGVSIPVISEMLGHKTQEITETYLKAFENSVLDDAVKKLL